MLFRPSPDCAIGNLSIRIASHYINTKCQGAFHPDVYAYGRDRMFKFKCVSTHEGEVDDKSRIHGFWHLLCPQFGEVMRHLIDPSEEMQERIDAQWSKIAHCEAGFHIRRGTFSEDSSKFAFFPAGAQKAVDAMVDKANALDVPVFVISDSVSTKREFIRRVPKAVALDLDIGFTACEHSQNQDTKDETLESKMNSVLEWFLLSKMPQIYTTMGGVCGRNVPEDTEEGVSSTFGYSAALYGGCVPHYVYNDGTIFYPDNGRLGWSDIDTGNYIIMRNPTKEKIQSAMKTHGMWKVLVDPDECERAGISEWCDTRIHVVKVDPSKPIAAKKLKDFDTM
jgi:hypothetical protein